MKICIISAATTDYLYRLLILYKSLRKFHQNIYFHAHLININKDNEFSKIKDKYLNISYSKINTKDKNIIKNYSSNIRARLLNNLMPYFHKLFWFDADTIIRKPIIELFDYLNTTNMVAYKNYNNINKIKFKGEYKTGIIGFTNCNINKKILQEWDYNTFKNGEKKCYWFQDQILISKLIFKYINYIKIFTLPKKFIDWNFNEKSNIWVGKGDRKNIDNYLLEEKKFI